MKYSWEDADMKKGLILLTALLACWNLVLTVELWQVKKEKSQEPPTPGSAAVDAPGFGRYLGYHQDRGAQRSEGDRRVGSG